MAHTKSAKKRLRQSKKRRVRNRGVKSTIKTQMKSLRTTLEENTAASPEVLRITIKKLDQAAAKGIIHPNQAARRKSRLTKAVNAKAKAAK